MFEALYTLPALLGPLQATPLAVRWGHFLALAVVLGGAAALALGEAVPPRLAARYEGAFWVALAVLVLTGVGNAGALAPAVPGPGTGWGRLFAAKLVAVVGFVGFSLVRSGVVHELAGDDAPSRWWYAVTAGWTAAVVALAVVMVRG